MAWRMYALYRVPSSLIMYMFYFVTTIRAVNSSSSHIGPNINVIKSMSQLYIMQ